eukprot:GHVU01055134.1.p1 GENE.GHVU01055134.1~~GHVU01055134.1.p1  ORF type:complete len:127 (-),score=2.38 GHVU01055134.1:266-646(-)
MFPGLRLNSIGVSLLPALKNRISGTAWTATFGWSMSGADRAKRMKARGRGAVARGARRRLRSSEDPTYSSQTPPHHHPAHTHARTTDRSELVDNGHPNTSTTSIIISQLQPRRYVCQNGPHRSVLE